jgi:hypothetical protein
MITETAAEIGDRPGGATTPGRAGPLVWLARNNMDKDRYHIDFTDQFHYNNN